MYLNGTILGMSRAEVRRRFDQIVDFSGLADFIDTPVKRYSSGMFARLGFSVAAHLEPDVLIVDEVLSVGDYGFQRKCLDQMAGFVNGNRAVVFVSHNMPSVCTLCRQAMLLDGGRIVAFGPAAQVVGQYVQPAGLSGGLLERMGLEVLRAELLDEAHRPCTAFQPGQRFTLAGRVRRAA